MSQQPASVYKFGPFRVDAVKRVLTRNGEIIPLTSKSLDTLLVLVLRRGQVVSKDDLMRTLWPDTVVEENNLTQQICTLRKALGEKANEHRYVVTVPGRGYSFVAEVNQPANGDLPLILEPANGSTITEKDQKPGNKPPLESLEYPPRGRGDRRRWSLKATTISLAAALATVALVSFWFSAQRSPSPVAHETRRSIAVLPFKALNSDPTNEYLSTGMADALIAKLSNVRQISVRPTSAIIKYSGQVREAQSVGRELGVDSVVEGTVQKSGERVRVTVQLVNVQDRNPVWAKSFDENITDIFSLQDTISEQIAQTMMVKLTGDEQRQLRKRDTVSVAAYQEYLRGRYFWNRRTQEGLIKSRDYFQQAIKLDQNYAQAYAGLADAYTLLVLYRVDSVTPDDAVQGAKAAAVRALEIDDTLAETHASLGMIKSRYDHDAAGAETEFRRAITLNPNYATGHHWYSEFLALTGREPEAMTEIRIAQELDPLSPVINTTLGERLYYARRYDEAITQLRRTLDMTPDFVSAHYILGLALEQAGKFEEAIAELQTATGAMESNANLAASLGHTYALAGQQAKARKILHELLAQKTCEPYEIAMVYQGLGDRQQALGWLNKIKEREGEMRMLLRLDPRLDSLRSEPQFKELLDLKVAA